MNIITFYVLLTLLTCGINKVAQSRASRHTLPVNAAVTVIPPRNIPQGMHIALSRCPASLNPFFVPSRTMNPEVLSMKIGKKLLPPQHGGDVIDRHFLITLRSKISERSFEAHLDEVCRALSLPGARGFVFRTMRKGEYFATFDENTLLRIARMREVVCVQYIKERGETSFVVA